MAVSRLALAGWTAIGALLAAPASGQSAPAPTAHTLTVSAPERTALNALQTAVAGTDRAAQDAALAAARTAAQSAEARYVLARAEFNITQQRGDAEGQARAVDALVASGLVPDAELPPLLANQVMRAFSAGQFDRADSLLARMAQLRPQDAAIAADYAQLKARRGDRAQAITWLERAISLQTAAGQAVPESWYQRGAALAYDGHIVPQSIAFSRALVTAYPSAENWRDALLVYRQSNMSGGTQAAHGEAATVAARPVDAALDLDIKRLLRATHGLAGERDYLDFASALDDAHLPGEAKAVLDEGVARGMLDTHEAAVRQAITHVTAPATRGRAALAGARTRALAAATGGAALEAGDAAYGYGEYAQAAELYRAALQKGGQDANLVNSRLGAALALAGQRAEAEAALHAVTGPRADLAAFWLAWLARPAA
jgi:tetratricopeptide (TPR) repeat protein